jgi:hypothetical protein
MNRLIDQQIMWGTSGGERHVIAQLGAPARLSYGSLSERRRAGMEATLPRRRADEELFSYKRGRKDHSTVRRRYFTLRKRAHTLRCDQPLCQFHTGPLIWIGKPLQPTMDHVDGNGDNCRLSNLRLLCPNCDSHNAETRGGANARRIVDSGSSYAIRDRRTGLLKHKMMAETGHIELAGGDVSMTVRKLSEKDDA